MPPQPILTMERVQEPPRGAHPGRPAEWAVYIAWPVIDEPPPDFPDETDRWYCAEARINHGRWIIDCPSCGAAQLAAETDPRFLCHVCFNRNVQGRWLPVAWPTERAEIEAALLPRLPSNRNWRPGESVENLLIENTSNGV